MTTYKIFLFRDSIVIYDVVKYDMERISKLIGGTGCIIDAIEVDVSLYIVEIRGDEKQLYNFMRAALLDLECTIGYVSRET